ncbi:MAG TPA: carboxypeptidase-like regulatory domain-containing protein, partial [Sediminibacterium sp.]|nr:carboxypeptidase-like regulatory domain-containing protein [Sediminibacterium sp.]
MKKIYSLSTFILIPNLIWAQSTFGSISGKVLLKEKLVAGAIIRLLDESTQTTLQTSSNRSGSYGFYQLKPG